MTDYIAVIPARYGIHPLAGQGARGYRGQADGRLGLRGRHARSGAREVIVATDDERIAAACREYGAGGGNDGRRSCERHRSDRGTR